LSENLEKKFSKTGVENTIKNKMENENENLHRPNDFPPDPMVLELLSPLDVDWSSSWTISSAFMWKRRTQNFCSLSTTARHSATAVSSNWKFKEEIGE
jgi:hypothetical protein